MGMAIPKQETTHKYGTATTDVVLSDADVDSVSLTVAETSWTPSEKKADTESAPGSLVDSISIFSAGPNDKP
jgi:hypothetical protein